MVTDVVDRMPVEVTEVAPAKLNLGLRILSRRADGYHRIDSVFVPVDLCDAVRIKVARATGRQPRVRLKVSGRAAGVPTDESNLAHRAAVAFLEAARGQSVSLSISLHKIIPPESGLGGGSSDAGAVLRGLNRVWRQKLPAGRLRDLAAGLGADVPFFLRCRPSRVTGIGDIVKPFRGQVPRWYLIAIPPSGVSTAAAYRSLRLTTIGRNSRVQPFQYTVSHSENDLEKVVLPKRPDIGRLKGVLLEFGADMALMSGSGSAVFGTFQSRRSAAKAAHRMPRGVRVFVVRSLEKLPPVRWPGGR